MLFFDRVLSVSELRDEIESVSGEGLSGFGDKKLFAPVSQQLRLLVVVRKSTNLSVLKVFFA